MELQLVNKEVAILAKELGFNWSCSTSEIIDRNNSIKARIGIPYQELLAKWLRDVHNMWVYCKPNKVGTLILWSNNLSIRGEEPYFDTYELAMEEGLRLGLEHLKKTI